MNTANKHVYLGIPLPSTVESKKTNEDKYLDAEKKRVLIQKNKLKRSLGLKGELEPGDLLKKVNSIKKY